MTAPDQPANRRQPQDRRTKDRRESTRNRASARIRFLRRIGERTEPLLGTLEDVSECGARFLIEGVLEAEEMLLVEVRRGASPLISFAAQIIWTGERAPGISETGCRLSPELTKKQLHALRPLVGLASDVETV